MRSDEISVAALAELQEHVARELRYLAKLTARMHALGFPANDPMKMAAERARETMQDLHVAVHYASCTHGVSRNADARRDG